MVTKVIRTTEGKLPVKIPSHISEVTLGMLIEMKDDKSNVETISILSGIPLDQLYLAKNISEFDVFNDNVLSLVHQVRYDCDNLPIPKSIFVNGRKVDVVKNLSIEPAGAFMECRNIIADEINEHKKLFGEDEWQENFQPSLEATALIIAHYLYCPATGLPYSDEKAEAFKEHILKLSITITTPIAKYFFLNYPNLWKPKVGFLQGLYHLWKRKLALRRLKRTGISTQ